MISVRQINQSELLSFVETTSSGDAFSGNIQAYYNQSGLFGPNILYTYTDQFVTGVKTFALTPLVPYSGSPNGVVSRLYVDTQDLSISGVLRTLINSISGQLSAVQVTGSQTINYAQFTGLGGTQIIYSGNQIFISGGAGGGGGGGSNVSISGSSTIANANFTGLGSVVISYDGTIISISGSPSISNTFSGYVESTFVHLTGTESISGVKTFINSPIIPNATLSTQAINYGQVTGISGSLQYAINQITGAAIGPSGAPGPSGAQGPSGAVGNFILSGITGNFVNMSFYYDQYNLSTGLNTIESFISRDFFFTGYAIGVINTGTQGYFSGSFYQRTPTNAKTNFINFSLNSGQYFTGQGGYNQTVSGMNRVGLDIYLIGTGITGLSVGLFGVGY